MNKPDQNSVKPSVGPVLEQWQEQLQVLRNKFCGAGVSSIEQVRDLSGLQLFEKMFAGQLPTPNMGEALNFIPVEFERGKFVFQGQATQAHLNPMGTVHGGWYATLLDSAMGCAVHTLLPAGRAYTTLEFKVNVVRGLPPALPIVRAIGQVIHAGRQVATAQARLVDADGTLYAHASTTCLIFDLPSA